LEQFPAAKLSSQESLDAYGLPTKTAVQSGEGFRKNFSKINAFLTSLTIQKDKPNFANGKFRMELRAFE